MEIFELRYFLGVAEHENIHRASEKLRISPGSLSKAISRLETELSIKLFKREGRAIRLTDQGKLLQKRASELVRLEEATRIEVAGHAGSLNVVVAGPEILLSKMGVNLVSKIKKKFADAAIEFRAVDDAVALEQVARGEAHLALVTSDVSSAEGLVSRLFDEANFQTYVSPSHALYSKSSKSIAVEEVLKHAFASPSNPLLGKVGNKQSLDGWRDDRFQRRVDYLTSSLKILEELVMSGKAVAYLPDYFGQSLKLMPLKITGCPYTCNQKVKLVARNPKATGWLNQLF